MSALSHRPIDPLAATVVADLDSVPRKEATQVAQILSTSELEHLGLLKADRDADAEHLLQTASGATTARFARKRGMLALKLAFRVAGLISNQAQAKLGYRVLSTPPRHARPLREQRLIERASAFAIPFGAGGMRGWRWGEGPAVLLVHSWGGRGAQLCEFVEPLLAQGLSPVTFDAPAHGASRGRRTDFLEYAAGVHAAAVACGPLAGVIAHSLGAATTLLAMRDWGLRTPRLVSIGAFNHCQWFTEAFGQLVGMRPAAVERMRAMFVERYSQRVNWSRLSVADALRQAETRALLVHDLEDREVPYAHLHDLRRARPDASLVTTRGLGHRRIVRDAEVIARSVSFMLG